MKIGIEFEMPTTDQELLLLWEHISEVPIRTVGYDHRVYDREWVIKSDSSCGQDGQNGCEAVSAPTRSYDEYDLTVFYGGSNTIFEALKRFDNPAVFRKCGFHVHHEWWSYDETNAALLNVRLDAVWEAYKRRSTNIDLFWGDYRNPDKNTNAKRYCDRYAAKVGNKYGQINMVNITGNSGRSNMCTVEFRQGGTVIKQQGKRERFLTFEEYVAWCAFVGALLVGITKPAGLLRTGCLASLPNVEQFVNFGVTKYGLDAEKIVSAFNFLIDPSVTEGPLL